MNKEVEKDMGDANKAIKNKVIPVLKQHPKLKGCEFICCENTNDPTGRMFDMNCGFDWFIKRPEGFQGMAARCQQITARCQQITADRYLTFTIRESRDKFVSTEPEKRIDAINNGCLYPKYTLQAYLKGDWDSDLDYFGICDTKKLFKYLEKQTSYNFIRNGSETFVPVEWSALKNEGITVLTHGV